MHDDRGTHLRNIVIGSRYGSVPEIINEGVTGLVVDSVEGVVQAVIRMDSLRQEAIPYCS